ncbi:MAG: acyltransferase, partial [Actinobacteria bacterium]
MTIYGGGGVEIGDNFHSGEDCKIISANHDYDGGDAVPYGHAVIGKKVVIEDNVWFGVNVIVLPGVTIGEGAIISAGAVVVKDVERCS